MEGELVIETLDPITDQVTTVALEAGLDGATCRLSDRAPHLSMDLEDLGACYLGRTRFRGLAALGRVKGDDASLRRADLMFGWDPQPWCPEVF
jgi:predicted acetyltransferase